MTDAEIKKALECPISEVDVLCAECPYRTHEGLTCHSALAKDALDLINRQKVEIEKLQADNSSMQSTLAKMSMGIEQAKAEAIKEYKDKVKSTLCHIPQHHFTQLAVEECLDKVDKEMVGEG